MYTKDDMNMYVGQYRVVCEFDRVTLKPCPEDQYIYCANGGQIYRFSDEVLVFTRPDSTCSHWVAVFKNNDVAIIKEWGDSETQIWFDESDIHKVAALVGVRTLGKDIKPKSKRNLKLFDWYKA